MPSATKRSTSTRSRSSSSSPNGSRPSSQSAGSKAKLPLIAGGAATAGLAAGAALGSAIRGRKRPRVLGLPMPKGSELKSGAEWLARMQSDVRAVRAQAEQSRKQSPIEVVLSALTSRRLPRHDG
jgi:hypothetical protein